MVKEMTKNEQNTWKYEGLNEEWKEESKIKVERKKERNYNEIKSFK